MTSPPPDGPKRRVFWVGSEPDLCDLCRKPLGDTFIDGATYPTGQWGILDPQCHARSGLGLGTGLGQQ